MFFCICDTSGVQFVAVCVLTGPLGHLLANDNRYEFSFYFIYFPPQTFFLEFSVFPLSGFFLKLKL